MESLLEKLRRALPYQPIFSHFWKLLGSYAKQAELMLALPIFNFNVLHFYITIILRYYIQFSVPRNGDSLTCDKTVSNIYTSNLL